MISVKSCTFKYINRGFKDTIAFIPGWATDHRIFETLNLKFNYLLPLNFSPFNFKRDFTEALNENNITKVSLFGWSLGGFVAGEFAAKYPDLIDGLILISIRKRYKKENLDEIRNHLNKSKKGYLYKFYTQCFCNKSEWRHFKENLFKDYLERFDLDYLLDTLDYLGESEIKPVLLKKIKRIKIIHGKEDRVAPIEEALQIKDDLAQAEFITIEDAGHIPFLKRDSGWIKKL